MISVTKIKGKLSLLIHSLHEHISYKFLETRPSHAISARQNVTATSFLHISKFSQFNRLPCTKVEGVINDRGLFDHSCAKHRELHDEVFAGIKRAISRLIIFPSAEFPFPHPGISLSSLVFARYILRTL